MLLVTTIPKTCFIIDSFQKFLVKGKICQKRNGAASFFAPILQLENAGWQMTQLGMMTYVEMEIWAKIHLLKEWIRRKFWCNIFFFVLTKGLKIKAAKIFQWVCLDESFPIWYGDLDDKWDKRRISQLLMHHYTKLELLFYCNYIFMEVF